MKDRPQPIKCLPMCRGEDYKQGLEEKRRKI